MPFRILASERVQDAVRRIAHEQIEKAISEIGDESIGAEETVHQVRKRCKKIRGLLRLVRPQLGRNYGRENDWYREAALQLADARDADIVFETFDAVTERYAERLDGAAAASLRAYLNDASSGPADRKPSVEDRLQAFAGLMKEGQRRIPCWEFSAQGYAAVEGGLRKSYSRSRKAMRKAYRSPSSAAFHEWRKRVKYHGYHVRLLQAAWDRPLEARGREIQALSELLGKDHDLTILGAALPSSGDGGDDGGGTACRVAALIEARQRELRDAARFLGRRLFDEQPKSFDARMKSYWDAWREAAETRVNQEADVRAEI
jgi:CHAD domain-containing protein